VPGRPRLPPVRSVSSHQSIRAADAPPLTRLLLFFRMSIHHRALLLDHSYAWLHEALARPPARPSPAYCYGTMRQLSRPLRFPGTQRLLCPWGPPLPAPTYCAYSWDTCNMKHLLQHTYKIDETFRIYSCNIWVWPLQHMQHPDKTIATYI
jgi:hypothetical protein